jgi:hypothetical protein
MFSVASGAGTGSSPMRGATASEPSPAPAYAPEPVSGEAIALGRLPSELPEPGAATKPGALITIKVADVKSATIPARDALQYLFSLPETEQKCALVGTTHGVGGFGRDIEVFLLTDDEYIFWNANPAAMPRSSWEPVRGSENTLNYQLPGAGTYHLVISNVMSPTPKAVQVKAQVKCVN